MVLCSNIVPRCPLGRNHTIYRPAAYVVTFARLYSYMFFRQPLA
jgi:hypothetical protein